MIIESLHSVDHECPNYDEEMNSIKEGGHLSFEGFMEQSGNGPVLGFGAQLNMIGDVGKQTSKKCQDFGSSGISGFSQKSSEKREPQK